MAAILTTFALTTGTVKQVPQNSKGLLLTIGPHRWSLLWATALYHYDTMLPYSFQEDRLYGSFSVAGHTSSLQKVEFRLCYSGRSFSTQLTCEITSPVYFSSVTSVLPTFNLFTTLLYFFFRVNSFFLAANFICSFFCASYRSLSFFIGSSSFVNRSFTYKPPRQ